MATTQEPRVEIRKSFYDPQTAWLIAGLVVNGLLLLGLTVFNFLPILQAPPERGDQHQVNVPADYDYAFCRAIPVLHSGRYKPLETAARDLMREIHGRERLLGHDAVAVLLMWMLEHDPRTVRPVSPWDNVPFILCEHQELRRLIYRLGDDGQMSIEEPTFEQVHGKYLSPNELKTFRKRLTRLKEENPEAYLAASKPVERQVDEALHRLTVYENIRVPPAPDQKKANDPLALVALDQVKNAPWFSIGDSRLVTMQPGIWQEVMKDRVKNAPQHYIKPEQLQALAEFQQQVQLKKGSEAIDHLGRVLQQNREAAVQHYLELRNDKKDDTAAELLAKSIVTWPQGKNATESAQRLQYHLEKLLGEKGIARVIEEWKNKDAIALLAQSPFRSFLEEAFKLAPQEPKVMADALITFLRERDTRILEDMRTQLPGPKEFYNPADPKYRMLHLAYLETRYPDVYEQAVLWQKPPLADISKVLASYDALGQAWRTGEAVKFNEAVRHFVKTVEQVSSKVTTYPGEDTVSDRLAALFTGASINPPSEELLALEQTFNRVAPFRYAWILMLAAVLLFVVSLGLDSKWCYRLGWLTSSLSLLLQTFGFFTRVIISGRPPVTNMYETVIWVAFMTSIFALILEAIYRKKVIALGGALVACIGLVLADNLPLALDPKINPLLPVLRSNFWLTIHVITIVSSYAGGALAWGLGNIALALIVFGWAKKDAIKTLSNFTYRALQIAVLLLAAGTFLGGWWAAYSWGRFWGWDPKETGALIALVCYVIPLHMRYIGWIKDFGLAVAAILCFATIMISWYGVNFVFPAGLHAYGFGAGGQTWVYWAMLLDLEWVMAACLIYKYKQLQTPSSEPPPALA